MNSLHQVNLTTSLWTEPMFHNRWNKDKNFQLKNTLLMCALCVTYAKQIGAHITMHTDKFGYEYLSKFGYDEVYEDLDILNERIKTNPTVLWAGGKSIALENEPLGTIHIDNDVFLTKIDCLNTLKFTNYYFIFQHVEYANYKEKIIFKDIITNFNLNKDFACCVGIIGFNSENAKRIYLDNYNYWFNNIEYTKEDNFINADLLLEQIFLYDMMEDMGYNGKSLIGDLRIESTWDIAKRSQTIGYEHVIGRSKFSPFILSKLFKRLQKLNPELYKIIESL